MPLDVDVDMCMYIYIYLFILLMISTLTSVPLLATSNQLEHSPCRVACTSLHRGHGSCQPLWLVLFDKPPIPEGSGCLLLSGSNAK